MFGPGVDNAIEKYLVPSRELLRCCSSGAPASRSSFRYDVIPGPKVFETQIHGKRFEMYNDTVLGSTSRARKWRGFRSKSRSTIRPAERVNWL